MLAPQKADPKKQYLSLAFVAIVVIVSGWLIWRQFFSADDAPDVAVMPVAESGAGVMPGDDPAAVDPAAVDPAAVDPAAAGAQMPAAGTQITVPSAPAAGELDLSFLESPQFQELRGEAVRIATSTERSVNPFVQQ